MMKALVCAGLLCAVLASQDLPYPLKGALNALPEVSVQTALGNRYVAALKSRNTQFMEKELMEISDPNHARYGEKLSLETIREITQAPIQERQRVISWLIERGFSHIQDWGDAIFFVSPNGTEQAYKHLLKPNVKYDDDTPRIISEELESLGVLFVDGKGMGKPSAVRILKNGKSKKVPKGAKVGGPPFSGGIVGRQTLEYLYKINNNLVSPANADGSSVASVEYQSDQGYSVQGLHNAQYYNNFPLNPIPAGRVIGGNNGINDESQLDVQIMQSISGDHQLWFWVTPGWLMSLATEVLNYAGTPPNVLSNSWGWAADQQCEITSCGSGGTQAYVQRVNAEYVKLGARRITFLAASGDAGAPGRTNEGCDPTRGVVSIFPGSSPYVVSVGGTYVSSLKGTVDLNKVTSPTLLCGNDALNAYGCANGTEEGITNFGESFLPIPWTAGGGFSFQFVSPSGVPTWQESFVSNYLSQSVPFPKGFTRTGRAYPDVAANSNQCAVFNDDGTLSPEAGTSCATPIVAAILSLVNWDLSKAGKPLLGFVNPMLYSMATSNPTSFNRPEPKNNGCTEEMCCPIDSDGSTIGYFSTVNGNFDSVSGLGSPNAGAWRSYLTTFWSKRDSSM